MSSALPPKPRVVAPKVRISIVASKYNETFTDALVENTIAELAELVPQGRVDLFRVSGAFEIPFLISKILQRDPPACVIALGVVIKGATGHAEEITRSVTDALQGLAVKHCCPVIHEVLLVDDEKQAYARCIGEKLNRGAEAARAAAAVIELLAEFERAMPHKHDTRGLKNA